MKIVRIRTDDGGVQTACLHPDQSLTRATGSIAEGFEDTGESLPRGELLAPLDPVAIVCIGLNYRRHAEEGNFAIPEHPVVFMKMPSAALAPGKAIQIPKHLASTQVDYECELAVVIGRECKNVSRAEALDYVRGYTCANDVSARDWQSKWGGSQWCRGKTFDTFCPLGPCLVTTDEIADPNRLKISTTLNGQAMQDWNTDDMIFDVPTLIEFLSGSTRLLPGTVILTGTPHGVGFAQDPPVYLKHGDECTIEIEGIGQLTNPVVDEGSGA